MVVALELWFADDGGSSEGELGLELVSSESVSSFGSHSSSSSMASFSRPW